MHFIRLSVYIPLALCDGARTRMQSAQFIDSRMQRNPRVKSYSSQL